MKKLLIITDTTEKQTNGVVRTLKTTVNILCNDFDVHWINPVHFKTVALPVYKEIDISLNIYAISEKIESINPDYIHIATEGPVGLAGKLYCDKKGYNYTTSYHSKFPEFLYDMFKVPVKLTYPYFRWFHAKSKAVLIPTDQVKDQLESKGFKNLVIWRRGVDTSTFNPTYRFRGTTPVTKYILCVSRVSKEKGLDDFCQIPVPDGYYKILVGDGPYLNELKSKYRTEKVQFLGKKIGTELSQIYADADVFIFPSKTDTFGLTQLESIASGVPVVAYKDTVSSEIINDGISGILVNTLDFDAILKALELDRETVAKEANLWSWESCTEVFKTNLVLK